MKGFIAEILRLFLGTAYAMAGFLKALDIDSFLEDIKKFEIIPTTVVVPTAVLIIAGEIFLGISLAAKFRTRVVAFFLAAMTTIFTVVVFVTSIHDRPINCGCFGSLFPEQVGVVVLVRDILFIAGCFWLSVRNCEMNLRDQGRAAEVDDKRGQR